MKTVRWYLWLAVDSILAGLEWLESKIRRDQP